MLLILAGVAISMLTGDNSAFSEFLRLSYEPNSTMQTLSKLFKAEIVKVNNHVENRNTNTGTTAVEALSAWSAITEGTHITYKITYKANHNETGGDATKVGAESVAPTVEANTFTAPEGQVFNKWNTKADGTGEDKAVGSAITSNVTLYAIWKQDIIEDFYFTVDSVGFTGSSTETWQEWVARKGYLYGFDCGDLAVHKNGKQIWSSAHTSYARVSEKINESSTYLTADGGRRTGVVVASFFGG